jgi:hypothetical protein
MAPARKEPELTRKLGIAKFGCGARPAAANGPVSTRLASRSSSTPSTTKSAMITVVENRRSLPAGLRGAHRGIPW